MTPEHSSQRDSTWSRDISLCLSVLMPPAAVLINLQIAYLLASPLCGQKPRLWIYLSSLMSLGACAIAAFLAKSATYSLDEQGRTSARARFMRMLGLMTSLFSGLVIIAYLIAMLMVNPCAD